MTKIIIFIFFQIFIIINANAQTAGYWDRTSIKFDGTDDFIDLTVNNRNINNQITIEVWVRTYSNKTQWLAGKYDSAFNRGYSLLIQNGRVVFGGISPSGQRLSSGLSSTIINDNNWHHIAGTYNSGTWEIWVDGVRENVAIGSPIILASPALLTVGKNSNNDSQYFIGNLGEIRFWNTARSAIEIRTYMCQYLKQKTATLVGYFTLNKTLNSFPSRNTVLKDESNLGLNGTLYSFINNAGYNTSPPPIGVESVNLYGYSPLDSALRLVGQFADTLTLRLLTGQPSGIQLYVTDRPGSKELSYSGLGESNYYFGVFTSGDTNTTYRVTHTSDTIKCRLNYYLFKRKNSFQYFKKPNQGNFSPITDKISETVDRNHGEYYFPIMTPAPLNYYTGSISLCQQNPSVSLTASHGRTFLWNTGDTSRTIQVSKPGKYFVKANDYCYALTSDTFYVALTKPLLFPAKPISDTLLCEGQPVSINLPPGFTAKWPDGSAGNQYIIQTSGRYTVELTEPNCGSAKSYSFHVKIVNCTDNTFIPNIITPNNDGLNDNFTIVGLPLPEWNLHIFNRWGNQVYESFNYKNDWNGTNLSDGVYFYLLRHKRSNKVYKGYVEVVK